MTESSPRNRILAALSAEDYAVLEPRLERVTLATSEVLFDVHAPIEHVYFPENMVASIVGVLADGQAIETATVGREGMVGLPLFLGTDRTAAQAFVQVPGPALRLPAEVLRAALDRGPALARVLGRYTQALFTLVGQSSACNRVHTMVERCARWLLHTHDRVAGDEFMLTHLFLSQMLGVRRATVTEAMGALQAAGAVAYVRGRITVLDRERLERSACECYAIIAGEFDRLLGPAGGSRRPDPLDGVATSENGVSVLGDGAPRGEADVAAAPA